MILFGAVLPSYESHKKDGKGGAEKQDVIKVDDPANRDKVRKLIESFE